MKEEEEEKKTLHTNALVKLTSIEVRKQKQKDKKTEQRNEKYEEEIN